MLKLTQRFKPARLVSLTAGLALILSIATPAAAATTPPVQITLGGSGATPWNIGNIAPGQSGTKVITVQNTGLYTGDLTIWISNIVNADGTPAQFQAHGTGDLSQYLTFKVTSSRVSSNVTMPTLLGNFPQSAADSNYVRVFSLRSAELITMTWQWSLPASVGNIVQGDSLSFDINYVLEQTGTAPPTTTATTTPPPTTTEPPETTPVQPPTSNAGVHNLKIQVNGAGTTDPVPGIYPVNAGDNRSVSAIAAPGWHFVNWTGDVADNISASSFVTMNTDHDIVANFAMDAPITTTTTPPPTTSTTLPPTTSVTTTPVTSVPPSGTTSTTPPTTTKIPTTTPVPTGPTITLLGTTTIVESSVHLDLTGKLDVSGLTDSPIILNSGDLNCSIFIQIGTRLLDAAGNDLSGITLYTYSDPSSPYSVMLVTLPLGASFSQPVTLVFHYDKTRVSDDQAPQLGIYLQAADGSWQAIPNSIVDTQAGTVTATIMNFSIYSIRLPVMPAKNGGTNWFLVEIMIIASLLIFSNAIVIVLRRRKKTTRTER